jgi:hypothetical protein
VIEGDRKQIMTDEERATLLHVMPWKAV